jgi:hypothetical protein
LIILAGLLLPVVAKADSAGWNFTNGSGYTNTGNFTYGIEFTVGAANINVDALGYFGTPTEITSNVVSLYDVTTGGNLIAQATINSSSFPGGNNFVYTTLGTPVTLGALDQYYIEGFTGTDKYTYGVSGVQTYLPITINGAFYQSGSDGYNLGDGGATALGSDVFGPDFIGYTVTPEPSTLLLLGSGLAGLAGLIKRKLMA